jgi:hypothetical protein
MTVSAGSPRAGRLLAMLLVVLLAASSLAAQAAMDGCAADCGTAQVEMLDHAEPECGACAAMAATPLVILAYPDTLAGADGPATVEFIAPPPREPPRT